MILARRVAATPGRTALVDAADGRRWSYRDLATAVDRVADRLRRCLDTGAGGSGATERPSDSPGDRPVRVGTLFEPAPAFVVTYHAVQQLGWTVVGLDPRLPADALGERVERAGVDLLACGDGPDTPPVDPPTLDVSPLVGADEGEMPAGGVGDRRGLSDAAGARPRAVTADDHLSAVATGAGLPGTADDPRSPDETDDGGTAAVLFTSGTTGEPKAVRLTRANLSASAVAAAFRLGISPGDRWLCCLPVHHVGGLAPVVRAALYGTTLVVRRGFDTEGVARALDTHGITGVSLVPTQLRRLLDAGASLASLETVLVGGAPTPRSLLSRALDAGVPVCPTYGLTEAASQVATARPAEARASPGTVGRPLYGVAVTVLADGEPAAAGERGELVVDGPTVSPGYLDPAATEAATGEWGLHTGDVGYRDEDGRLWVLGRRDDLVLTGGELVVPREVAETIRSHPDVTDAAVVGIEDPEWGQRVAALVAGSVDRETVRAHCRGELPGYKRPKTVVLVDGLPRTASGTVDREAVRERLRAAA